MIKAGKYRATIKSAGMSHIGQKGNPAFGIMFEFDCEGKVEHLLWLGYLTAAASEYTMNTLAELKFDEDRAPIMEGEQAKYDASYFGIKEVEIVVEMEPGQGDKSNKVYPKIKFINVGGGTRFQGLAVEKMNLGFNFKDAMKAARMRKGEAPLPAPGASVVDNSDLPF